MSGPYLRFVSSERDSVKPADVLGGFIGEVADWLGRSPIASDALRIDVIHSFNAVQVPTESGRRVAIFLASEEGVIPSSLLEHYDFIFANYTGPARPGPHRAKVHPFPLGFYAGRRVEAPKPLAERAYDFCFMGTLNVHRLALFDQFARPSVGRLLYQTVHRVRRLPKTEHATEFLKRRIGVPDIHVPPRYFLHFGQGWSKGVEPAEYARVLSESRVVACPRGWSSTETFRHYEAAMAGCVVMTEPLPRTYFYEGAPFVEVRDWSNLVPRIEAIGRSIRSGAITDRQTRDFYQEHMSAQAAAAHIARVVSEG